MKPNLKDQSMFKSKAKKEAEHRLKVEKELQKLKELSEKRKRQSEEVKRKSYELCRKTAMWWKRQSLQGKTAWIVGGITLLAITSISSQPSPHELESRRQAKASEAERLKQVEAEKAKDELAKAKAESDAAAKFKNNFGFASESEFRSACRNAIVLDSGTTELWNSTDVYEYPSIGSLVMNQSAYGVNAFGTKVEYKYKCWNVNRENSVQTEMIGAKFHQ